MLNVFKFQSNQVRIFIIDGEVWFVASDVAIILGYADPSKMLNLVDSEDKRTENPHKLDNPKMAETFNSNTFRISLINESGLYACIFGSTKLEAKVFKKWVTSELLPTIRKTGKYSVNDNSHSLPPHEVAVQKARAIAEIEELLINQPKLAQFLIDHTISDLMEQKRLTGAELRGVVEIAKDMGFKVDYGNRTTLGKFVRSQLPDLGVQEKRLVNGEMRAIWCYPDTDEVRKVVSEFFN